MPLPTVITDLSATAASNYPAGTDAPAVLDDTLRAHAGFIRNLLDATISNVYTAYTTAGTSTAYTIAPSPAITAYAANQSFFVTFNAASGAAPTLQISGLATPPNLVKQLGDGTFANIAAGEIPINHRSRVTLLSATQALVEELPFAVAGPNNTQLAGHRNKIINGNLDIWQRGTSFTVAGYAADRWAFNLGGGAATVSRQEFALGQTDVPGEPAYFIRHDRTTAATGVNSPLYQRIESVRTFAGQTATIHFYAKAAAAKTFKVRATQHFGTGGTPSADVITAVGDLTLTTAWQKFTYTVAIPSISGKTLGTANNDYLQFDIYEDAGFSLFVLDVARAQVEIGTVGTPFEGRLLEAELNLCLRYAKRLVNGADSSTEVAAWGFNYGTGSIAMSAFCPPMRAVPALTFSALADFVVTNGAGSYTPTGITVAARSSTRILALDLPGGALTAGTSVEFRAAAGAASIMLSSEL